jgi:hypothetical protein
MRHRRHKRESRLPATPSSSPTYCGTHSPVARRRLRRFHHAGVRQRAVQALDRENRALVGPAGGASVTEGDVAVVCTGSEGSDDLRAAIQHMQAAGDFGADLKSIAMRLQKALDSRDGIVRQNHCDTEKIDREIGQLTEQLQAIASRASGNSPGGGVPSQPTDSSSPSEGTSFPTTDPSSASPPAGHRPGQSAIRNPTRRVRHRLLVIIQRRRVIRVTPSTKPSGSSISLRDWRSSISRCNRTVGRGRPVAVCNLLTRAMIHHTRGPIRPIGDTARSRGACAADLASSESLPPRPPAGETLPPASTRFSAWAVRLITSGATRAARCAGESAQRASASSGSRPVGG